MHMNTLYLIFFCIGVNTYLNVFYKGYIAKPFKGSAATTVCTKNNLIVLYIYTHRW